MRIENRRDKNMVNATKVSIKTHLLEEQEERDREGFLLEILLPDKVGDDREHSDTDDIDKATEVRRFQLEDIEDRKGIWEP